MKKLRAAAIDIGSNSTRLLVGDVDKNDGIKVIRTGLATTRLGEGMTEGAGSREAHRQRRPHSVCRARDISGAGKKNLSPLAVERTLAVLESYQKIVEACHVDRIVVVATNAVREAANGQEFARQVKERIGVELKILSGEQEAYYSYVGVLSGFRKTGVPGVNPEDFVVMDVGGGSTEFIWLTKRRVCCFSVKAGAVRMTEGKHSDEQIREILRPVLSKSPSGKGPVVGVGGTATTMAAVALGLVEYDPARIHGYVLTLQEIGYMLQMISTRNVAERRKIPGLPPDRADIIPAGMRIFKVALEETGRNILCISETGLLHGLLAAIYYQS